MQSDPIVTPEQNMTVERLKSLYELIGRINSVHNLQELLEFIMDRALNLTRGNRGLLLLSNNQEPTLKDVVVIQGEAVQEEDLDRILEFASATVIKDVLDRGEPRLVADLHNDARYDGIASVETLRFKNIRSILAVPLKAEEQLVGLIYIDHPRDGIFGQGDLDFLHAFANQAALAIQRERVHQQQVKDLTLLNRLSRTVVKVLDLNEVLTRIISEVTEMLKVESSSVLLLDDTDTVLTFATSVSNGETVSIPTRLNKKQGIAGWVMTHGEPACVNDVSQDSRWFGEVETGFVTQSLLCVPLQTDGRVVGVLEALNKKILHGFGPADIALLSAFAASATIAIENAKLFQEARQARKLKSLNEIAMTLSSNLDLRAILDEGLEQALTILKSQAGVINLTDNDKQLDLLSVQLGQGISPDPVQAELQTQALNKVSSWMLSQNINTVFADESLIVDKHKNPSIDDLDLTDSSIEALAIAPIKVSSAVSGSLAVINLKPHTYSLDEINLLNGIARIIGLTAQNAVHHLKAQEQTKQLTYLNEIGSVLTRSLNVDQVLEVIIDGVNTLLQTELTSVFLIDGKTNELVLSYSTKHDTEIRLPYPWQGIAGWVAREDQPALVNNTYSDSRHLRKVAQDTGYEAHSILCVPLKVEGQVIGVVEVLNKIGGQQFTHKHQTQLVELTKWAAIALHNARLYNERVQAYEHLNAEQQRRIAAETRGAMAAVILDMAHTMNNIIGAIRVWATMLQYASEDTPQYPIAQFDKAVGQIRQNAEEALKLMSTMTGPLEVAVISPTNIHHCLDTAIKSCWCPDNITIIKQYNQDIPLVKANAERLEAVFHNLISNAIQAMTRQGGKITINTHLNEQGWGEVIIVDNGPGIPAKIQDRIFDPGISGRERGLGIGLWLVETFIYQFGGQIDLTKTDKNGTTFTIKLQPSNSGENDQ